MPQSHRKGHSEPMKKLLPLVAALALAAALFVPAAPAATIVTINLEKVFAAHPRTAVAEAKLNEQEEAAKAELARIQAEGETMRKAVEQERAEARNALLSDEAKSQHRDAAEKKAAELEAFLLQARRDQESKLRRLREEVMQTRKEIVDEMNASLAAFAEARGYGLVFDISGLTMNGVPAVAYARPGIDVTQAFIAYIQSGGQSVAAAAASKSND